MDYNQLNEVLIKEKDALENLLQLLEEQYVLLLKNDVFGLESITDKINAANKSIATTELERRGLVKGTTLQKAVDASEREDIDDNFRKVRRLVNLLKIQKENNEQLIKQGLSFSSKMLMFINPDRNTKVYNSYGKMKR
ncbi:flagellar export chaperone FlgN [Clostridium oryzae]|uniref:FlgN protein n=1 Tax=Clostridium oryzae TaxID=1450648 RepID=A0A1V4ILH7_9CLOT|nr:flagellar export chaperone FlgN [Clostridium oryzae]OPJ60872.1 FlgN protein [Clostridium oryzae]